MNKKVLVITLALVIAFASSAMAAVKIGGDFTATLEQDTFKVFEKGYKLTPAVQFKLTASGESKTNWSFTARLNSHTKAGATQFGLDRYKLELNDQYFDAWVWGKQDLTDKGTQFSMIKAPKKAGDARARVAVPIADLATITLDFDPTETVRAFIDGKVEGYDVGLAYARKGAKDGKNIIVGYGKGTFNAGDFAVNAKAEAGVILGDDLGLAFGFGVDTNVTKEVKVEANVTNANANWKGADALTADNTVLFGKGTFTNDELEAFASVKETFVKDGKNVNEIEAGAKYRLSTKVSYNNLFHNDHWFKNAGLAAGLKTKFVDVKFDNVRADVVYPVVDDMVWVRGYASYDKDKEIKAGADARIQATNKLRFTPAVDYKSTGKEIDAKFSVTYLVGTSSDAEVSFLAQKVFNEEKDGKELLQASVKVPF